MAQVAAASASANGALGSPTAPSRLLREPRISADLIDPDRTTLRAMNRRRPSPRSGGRDRPPDRRRSLAARNLGHLHARRSSKTSRSRPSWRGIASAGSDRCGRGPGPPSTTSRSSPARSRASRWKAIARRAPPGRCWALGSPRKPIELEIPLMVTGMSYGALSRNAKTALARGRGWRAPRRPPATAACSTSNAPSRGS